MYIILPVFREYLEPLPIRSSLARDCSPGEIKELNRIFSLFAKAGSDPNVSNVTLKDPLSERQILYILNSDCAELIEAMFQILALGEQKFSLDSNNKYSLLLHILYNCPQILPVLRTEYGWKHVPDCTDTLRSIRVYIQYYRRPKRTQRHRGYRDKGSLPDEQFKLRQSCLSEYYAHEAKLIIEHDRELKDTIEFLVGLLQ